MYQHKRFTTSSFNFFQKFKNFDYILLVCILLLGFLSLTTMYSTDGGKVLFHTKSHFTKLIVFTIMMLIISFINIKYWFYIGYISYLLVIGLLIWTYLFGITSSGSQRWIDLYFINLQPSELMKIGLILFLAKYYHRISIENINQLRFLFLPIVVLIAPLILVATQPDLGTALLIAAGGLTVAWLAGVRIKFFAFSGLAFLALLPIAISFLKPYQKSRILTFLNPERDPLGAGYQIIQSKIAIGSGGLFGKGFLQGSQSYLDYLPEKHTDFIFTLFSEEFGFFGSLFILFLYAVIVWRIVKIGNVTRSNFGKLYCYSFATAFFIYVVVNMMMVLGLLPIVGSPLPIMSYGGSSMMAIMFGLGIAMSCKVYKDTPVN